VALTALTALMKRFLSAAPPSKASALARTLLRFAQLALDGGNRAAPTGAATAVGGRRSRADGGRPALLVGFERIRIGARVNAMSKLRLDAVGSGTITIGDECSINDNVQISCGPCGAITLGEAIVLGANVVLRNCNHGQRDPTRRTRDQRDDCADIRVAATSADPMPGPELP
jgi:hypothetical protein